MSARSALVAHLRDTLPTWAITTQDQPLSPSRTTVLSWVEQVTPGPGLGLTTWTLTLVLIPPRQVDADPALEAALDELLAAIEAHDVTTWTQAERATWDETWPAYRVTCTVTTHRA